MLFFQIFPVSLKIIIMRFSYAGFSCICCIIEIHPIMVKHLFSEYSKGAFSLREFVNLYDPSDIPRVSTARSVTCNFPFGLDKDNKMLNNRFYGIQFVYAIYFQFILSTDTLLIKYPQYKMTFIRTIRIIRVLFHFAITEISPI